ncbi:hypothetical protein IWQ61_006876 [Dispira simplex]|nr:hypothetical protein IWQ61_006876 [Dispira simplex]
MLVLCNPDIRAASTPPRPNLPIGMGNPDGVTNLATNLDGDDCAKLPTEQDTLNPYMYGIIEGQILPMILLTGVYFFRLDCNQSSI